MKITHILFDLDNTLYRASGGLFDEIRRRMTRFVARYFNVSEEAATAVRREYALTYGTTLGGLLNEGGLADPEEFIADVHPHDVAPFIQADPGLRPLLEGLPQEKSILTNSPREHADRVLDFLGVADCFPRVFDIRFSGFRGKPLPEAYQRALETLGASSGETLFVDDVPAYLEGYRRLGGPVVQVREDGISAGDWPCVRDVKELPALLGNAAGEWAKGDTKCYHQKTE